MAKRFLAVANRGGVFKFRWQRGVVCSKNSKEMERTYQQRDHDYLKYGPSYHLTEFEIKLPMEFLE